MPTPQDLDHVRMLLEGLSPTEIAQLCIEALRRTRVTEPGREFIQMHGHLGRELVALLSGRKVVVGPVDANALKEVFLSEQYLPWMVDVVDFVWWMVRSGLAVPIGKEGHGYPVAIRLTRRGAAFLDAAGDDHPLLPGWPGRVRGRCPGLPDGVIALLVDARTCM